MSYDARTRDRYRLAVLATTASLGVAAITATGWLTGAAAHAQDEKEALQQAKQDADARAAYDAWATRYGDRTQQPRTVVRERPTKIRVTNRYVTPAPTSPSVGGGGTVTGTTRPAPAPAAAPPAARPAAQPAQPAPPPPPPPRPAPSSGS